MPLCAGFNLYSAATSSFMAPCRLFPPLTPSPLSHSHSPSRWTIRMGGGPRTFPGGVSKWEWKRMQAKKSKQLLKARLCRERQIYEMRRRAELRAAAAELERPWDPVASAPALFSVRADEQVKVLADRFNRPGGYDLWTEQDGPQIFRAPDGITSARFFPKGAVHSVKPYEAVSSGEESTGKPRRRRKDETADVGIDLGEELLKQGERKVEWDQKADSFGIEEKWDSFNTDPEMSNAVWWKEPGSLNSDSEMSSARWRKETGSSNSGLDNMGNARLSKEPSSFNSDSRVRNARWSKEPRSLNSDSQVRNARWSEEPRSLNSDSQVRSAKWSKEPKNLNSDSQVKNARRSKEPRSLNSDSQVRNARWSEEPRSLNSDSQVRSARWSKEPKRLNSDSQVKNARWSEEPRSLNTDSQVKKSRWSEEPRSLNSDSQGKNARWSKGPRNLNSDSQVGNARRSEESRSLNSDSQVRNARWSKEPRSLSSDSKLKNGRWRKKSESLTSGLEKSNARWRKESRGLSWRESGSLSDSELSNPKRRMTSLSTASEMSNVSRGRINGGRQTRVPSSPGGGLKSNSSVRRGGLRGARYQLDPEDGFRGRDACREDDL